MGECSTTLKVGEHRGFDRVFVPARAYGQSNERDGAERAVGELEFRWDLPADGRDDQRCAVEGERECELHVRSGGEPAF